MDFDIDQQVFFELLRAGLWGDSNDNHNVNGNVYWGKVYQLAQKQSVQGLVLQGLEWYREHQSGITLNVPQILLLQWIGEVQMIEQRNKEMNGFIAGLIEQLRKEDVYAILVKGQGIAQCYEKPVWRSCGDVDLLLNSENYEKAKQMLLPFASVVAEEDVKRKHLALTIDNWTTELHGTLHTNLWSSLEQVMDDILQDVFCGGYVTSLELKEPSMGSTVQFFQPRADENVVFIFAHILQHFYMEGIGLRQICDWCRLLWTYKDSLNHGLLESRIRKAGMLREWKVFAAFASEYLGMPADAMPFYDNSKCWKRKANIVLNLVLESGNFGQGKDKSYKQKYHKTIRYCISFVLHAKDTFRRFCLFPTHALIMWWKLMMLVLVNVARGK